MDEYFSLRLIYFDYYFLNYKDREKNTNQNIISKIKSSKIKQKTITDLLKIDTYSHFMQREITQVPIVRIFGTTYRGQKCCLNIHNYFPYFYIEINKENYFPIDKIEYLREFANQLEKIFLKYTHDKDKDRTSTFNTLKNITNNTQIIHKIEIVEKYAFYGYSSQKRLFLKIFLYDPNFIKPMVEILQSGIMRGRYYQCYEAHLSYCMHFMADNNLWGMKLIKIKNFSFRYDIPDRMLVDNDKIAMHVDNIIWSNSANNNSNSISISYENLNNFHNNSLLDQSFNNEEQLYSDLKIWDYYNLFNQGYEIVFNNLNKSSKSSIEIDIDVRDILNAADRSKTNINMNLNMSSITNANLNSCLNFSLTQSPFIDKESQADFGTNNQLNRKLFSSSTDFLPNQTVNRKNLNQHIKYTKTLIELWEDEIERREELGMEDLKFEKISDQNNFHLTQNYLSKQPEQSLNLLKLNTKLKILSFEEELGLEEDFEDLSNSAVLMLNPPTKQNELFEIFTSDERYKILLNKKKRLGFGPKRWYNSKSNKRGNFLKLGKDLSKLKNESNINFSNGETCNTDEAEIDDIMSTISEISIPIQKRKQIKEIMTTRSIDEYFSKSESEDSLESLSSKSKGSIQLGGIEISEDKNSSSEHDDKIKIVRKPEVKLEDNYKLLTAQKSTKSFISTGIKLNKKYKINSENDSIENVNLSYDNKKSYFTSLYKNLYSFRKMFPSFRNLKSKLEKSYHYNIKINKFLLSLYYSDAKDYLLFLHNKQKPLQINKSRMNFNELAFSHTGLNYFLQNYNKVIKPIDTIWINGVNKRKEEIIKLKQKLKNLSQKRDNETNYDLFDDLKVLTYLDLIFLGKNRTDDRSSFNLMKKIHNRKIKSENKKNYDQDYFKTKFTSKAKNLIVDSTNLQDNVINNLSSYTEMNATCFLINYHNEISPVSDKKNSNQNNYNFQENKLNVPLHQIQNKHEEYKNLIKNIEQMSNLTIFSTEVFCEGREDFTWTHEKDPIVAIFCAVHDENAKLNFNFWRNQDNKIKYNYFKCILTTSPYKSFTKRHKYNNLIIGPEFTGYKNEEVDYSNLIEVIYAKDEINLIVKFIEIFNKYDPEFVVGYETEVYSIAYIIRRGEYLGIPVKKLISRNVVPEFISNIFSLNKNSNTNNTEYNQFNSNSSSAITMEQYIRDNFKKNKIEQTVNKNLSTSSNTVFNNHHDIKYMEQKFGKIIKLKGRVIINLWRILESELKLTNYTIENIVFNVLKIREAEFSKKKLSEWYKSNDSRKVVYSLLYFMKRTNYNLILLDELDFINRDIQFTKIYGIDFESSLTRGSQYRVEGVLCRVTKANDYLLLSASREQLNGQHTLEYIPLVREPPKNIFYSPIAILDFQSLYPSIMIGYNICYSTCLGKLLEEDIDNIQKEYKEDYLMFNDKYKKFGVYRIEKNIFDLIKDKIPKEDLNDLDKIIKFIQDNCTLTPNKTLFVKKHIREGVLPIILKELLLTRIMIKNSCKKYDKKSQMYKILYNRQLGLKLLANVTYGYISAGFSGRMPSSEIGDSVVAIGKETLLNAMKIVEDNKSWGAKVIYGDTDSLFILLEGRTPEQAVIIGKEIADTVTKANPEPMKLQFEKIYCPMVLLSKKHYAGYKYEDCAQIKTGEKVLESKGIETVRRDTCEAVNKIMEKCLKIIFDKKDLSEVKKYLYRVFDKLITGRAMIKDFIFAKEVRLGTYRGDTLPPSAQIAYEKHLKDPDYLPRYKVREPYVVIENPQGSKKLKDCIMAPEAFFANKNAFLNCKYYIEKQILPAISRILDPIDVDVFEWYNKYPRPIKNSKNLYFKNFNIDKNMINFEDSNVVAKGIKKNVSFFNQETSSKYQLVKSNEENNSKTIDNYFSKKKTDVEKNDYSSKIRSKENSFQNQRTNFLIYKDSIDNLKNSDAEDLMNNKDGRANFMLEQIKKNKICMKRVKYENICRFCSEFDKYNISEDQVPCALFLCKFFYEKLLLNENLE